MEYDLEYERAIERNDFQTALCLLIGFAMIGAMIAVAL